MLSPDELATGITFILKLKDATGIPVQWVQSLRGAVAKHWYDIYTRSDWISLRAEAAAVFLNSATESDAEHIRRNNRCVVIKTDQVKSEELASPR
jgi:hypothetical protein